MGFEKMTTPKPKPKPKPIKKTITIRGVTYWRSAKELAAAEKHRIKVRRG
jgi:hypothetical protein